MTCFQFTPITGALFLTGMAANPLCAHLAKEGLGVDISWGTWLWAALLPAAICFVILPHVTKFLVKPTMTKTPEAKALGKKMLGELGALTHQEKLVGVGFKAEVKGQVLEMSLGYSHDTHFLLPKEVTATAVTEKKGNPIVTLKSADKQLIGQVAAKLRSLRKPEPYKGKGIKFVGEQIRRKAGKSAGAK